MLHEERTANILINKAGGNAGPDAKGYRVALPSAWMKVSSPLSSAFGVNRKPTWDDLQIFLKDRCVPQERDGLKYYLSDLGLDCYDPLAIIRKTEGRMAEDSCWIKIVEG